MPGFPLDWSTAACNHLGLSRLLRNPCEYDLLSLRLTGASGNGELGRLQYKLALLVGIGNLGESSVLLATEGLLDNELGLADGLLENLLTGHTRLPGVVLT